MNLGGNEATLPTVTAQPSASAPTQPGDQDSPRASVDPTIHNTRPIAPSQLRDRGRYQVLGEHGRGGLGRVARVHDLELRRDIAIKELLSRNDIREARFVREAMITARLEHPGIVPVYEAGRWSDGTPFYAMKLVSGRPLRYLIDERTTVEQRIALLHHVVAVADAIAYAHGRNIIHRDLKPANIIVGDFGETVVIDWGLAKDLTASDDLPRSSDGSSPFQHDSDLTVAGSVLGTPSYMAPEQERGEPVDQRADVFAIGAMLWELCSLQRVPPIERRQRHLMLRRAGIDHDLATIIDKALAADPAFRYPDAGAIAADLKAFKSGARIAARNYSFLAMLAHWTRRHRTLALSTAAAHTVATIGIVVFVFNIATERDRADANAAQARVEQHRADRTTDELLLRHAELLLKTDPTASYELLKTYQGRDVESTALLRARAMGLGVATLRAKPNTDEIDFARRLSDGSLLTLGGGTVAKTSGAGRIRTIARGVPEEIVAAFAEATELLAYACNSGAICLLRSDTEQLLSPTREMSSFGATSLAFSSSGRLLAAISAAGDVRIWIVPDGRAVVTGAATHLPGGLLVRFVDEQTLVAATQNQIYVLQVSNQGTRIKTSQRFSKSAISDLEVHEQSRRVAVATRSGELDVIELDAPSRPKHISLCKGAVNSIALLQQGEAVGYACQDGVAGVWDLHLDKQVASTHIEGGWTLAKSDLQGKSLAFGANGGEFRVYDFQTKLFHKRSGHLTRITSIISPTNEHPYWASGGSNGTLIVWSKISKAMRVGVVSRDRLIAALLHPLNGALIATGVLTVTWSLDGNVGELRDHEPGHYYLSLARSDPGFALFGPDEFVELWSFSPSLTRRTLRTTHGAVTALRYLDGSPNFLTAGRDGRLLEWSPDGLTNHERGRLDEPIRLMNVYRGTNQVVVLSLSGELSWLNGAGFERIATVAHASRMVGSADGRWLAVGTTTGQVFLYSTTDWKESLNHSFPESVRDLAFSPDGEVLTIAAGAKIYRLDTILSSGLGADASRNGIAWSNVSIQARNIVFSRDGKWFAATCADGTIWFYAISQNTWISNPVSSTDVFFGIFSEDDHQFIATDAERALLVDMKQLIQEHVSAQTESFNQEDLQ